MPRPPQRHLPLIVLYSGRNDISHLCTWAMHHIQMTSKLMLGGGQFSGYIVSANENAWRIGDWLPLVVCFALAVAYMVGYVRMFRHTSSRHAHAFSTARKHATLFALGWLGLAASLGPYLYALSDQLLSAHIIQHELLTTIAAPLVVLSKPYPIFVWALPMRVRRFVQKPVRNHTVRSLWAAASQPVSAWTIFALTIWFWHAPAVFQLGLASDLWHAVQHLCVIGASLLFWQAMFFHSAHVSRGTAVVLLLTTAFHSSVLGALITFDGSLWYPMYDQRTAALGIVPLSDQQWSGLIMWIPGSIPFVLAALQLTKQWLRESSMSAWQERSVQS